MQQTDRAVLAVGEHVHVLLQQSRRHPVSRRLLVGQLMHSSDNVVSGQLIKLVQQATRRCSCVLWLCGPVHRHRHTNDIAPPKVVLRDVV